LKRWSIVALAALVVAVACSTEDFSDQELPGIEDGAHEGVSKSVQVDGSEAQAIALETGASITIPKSAVDHELTIGMERPDDKKALTLVKSVKSLDALASAPYVLTPHGTKFKQPVTVELPVGKSTQKKLVVGWLEDENDTEWKKLGTPEVSGGKAKIEIDHFSVLVVLEEEGAGLSDDTARDAGADGGSNVPPPDASAQDAGTPLADAGVADARVPPPDAMPPDVTPPDKDAGAGGTVDAGTGIVDAGTGVPDAGNGLPDAGTMSDAGQAMDAWVDPPDAGAPLDTGTPVDDDTGVADDDAEAGAPDAVVPDAAEVQEAAAQLPDGSPV
jgi:hypothetical protein